jgi:hypothetical protein
MYRRSYSIVLSLLTACLLACGPKCVAPPLPVDQESFLVHRVTRDGETVRSLSKWYTGSEKLADEIAKASNVSVNTPLKPWQRVYDLKFSV